MSTIVIGAGVVLFVYALGVLTGSGRNTRTQDVRDRRQAATQRRLNEQRRALAERREADEEKLHLLTEQRAALVIIDHDAHGEAEVSGDVRFPSPPPRA